MYKCPICEPLIGTIAGVDRNRDPSRDVTFYDCPRCGKYQVSGLFLMTFAGSPNERKALSTALRTASDMKAAAGAEGDDLWTDLYNSGHMDLVAQHPGPQSMNETKTTLFRHAIALDGGLGRPSSVSSVHAWCARLGLQRPREVKALLDGLRRDGLVDTFHLEGDTLTVTPSYEGIALVESAFPGPNRMHDDNGHFVVFYSWESDRPNATNRGLILNALEAAAKDLRTDPHLEIHPVVDRDTQGVAGSPDIASTIFGKIGRSQAFVADITFVDEPALSRRMPNPNVLVELGYAIATLGWERIVLVQNLAFGEVSDLPFDLKQRRVMTYTCGPDDSRGEARRKLAKTLVAAIASMLPDRPQH